MQNEVMEDEGLWEVAMGLVPMVRPSALLRERVLALADPRHARVVTDKKGAILSVSKGFTELCGYTLSEIRGKKPGSFLQGPGTDLQAVRRFREAIAAAEPCTVELLNYHKCGTPYWVRVEMKPIFEEERGRLLGYCALETKLSGA